MSKKSHTILLVDDDEIILRTGTRMLSRIGYNTVTAGNGKEALELIKEKGNEISLVLLDLTMPEMDGKHVLVEIRKISQDLKVVMASGYSCLDEDIELTALSPSAFLVKPFGMNELSKLLDKLL